MLTTSDLAAGRGVREQENDAEQAVEVQAYEIQRKQWLQHGMTMQFLRELEEARIAYETQAKDLAVCDEVQSASRVRALLIQSRTIEKVIEHGRNTTRTTTGFSVA